MIVTQKVSEGFDELKWIIIWAHNGRGRAGGGTSCNPYFFKKLGLKTAIITKLVTPAKFYFNPKYPLKRNNLSGPLLEVSTSVYL